MNAGVFCFNGILTEAIVVPSSSKSLPIPKNRHVGEIPFLRHTWILGDFGQIIKYMNTCKSKTIKIIGPPELLIVNTY